MIKNIICVGLGSMLGGALRYIISNYSTRISHSSFPIGTLAVNLIGCFLLGLVCGVFKKYEVDNTHLLLFLSVGFCGGFTTFSTFINESNNFLIDGNALASAGYAAISLFLGLLFLWTGQKLPSIL